MSYPIQQSTTQSALLFFLTLASDHISPATGLSPTVTLSKNGAAFASPSGAVSEIANGWYKVAGNATDTATLGPLALHASVATADNCDMIVAHIVAYNPQDGVHLGLTAIPNVATGTAGAIPTVGTGTGQIAATSGVVTANTTQTAGVAVLPRYTGTAQTGNAGSITLANGVSALQCGIGDLIILTGGTGAGQSGIVASVAGMGGTTPVASMVQNWQSANPDGTTTYEVVKTGQLLPAQPSDIWNSSLAATRVLTSAANITNTGGTIPIDAAGNVSSNILEVASIAVHTNGTGTQNIGGP